MTTLIAILAFVAIVGLFLRKKRFDSFTKEYPTGHSSGTGSGGDTGNVDQTDQRKF